MTIQNEAEYLVANERRFELIDLLYLRMTASKEEQAELEALQEAVRAYNDKHHPVRYKCPCGSGLVFPCPQCAEQI